MGKALGIIPARFGSSRFPGKPLADICGRPMIQHVFQRASRARLLDDLWVATDDRRIASCVIAFGGKAVMTSVKHRTGTDRIHEALKKIEGNKRRYGIVVNIQGDEPLLDPKAIDLLIRRLGNDEEAQIATAVHPISDVSKAADSHTVKVALDRWHRALYFSRSPIPCYRNPGVRKIFYQHIGIYAFRQAALERFCKLKRGQFEMAEELEQLRALENGMKIAVVMVARGWPAVDRPSDVEKIKQYLINGSIN